jgi:hypothetical protein
MIYRILLFLGCLFVPIAAEAQSGSAAHLYAYRLNDRPAFERGYRKHLEWHARVGDRLAWYGWYVIAGQRVGAFVDGTFGATFDALANRPDPKGDAADFKENAAGFARAIGDEAWDLWREASTAVTLEQRRPTSRIEVYLVEVKNAPRFEAAILQRPVPATAWYRAPHRSDLYLLIGSEPPADKGPDILRLLGRDHAALLTITPLRSEVWRYERFLTRIPRE